MAAPVSAPASASSSDAIGILVVSANSSLRKDLRARMHSPRWNVVEASSGADAIEKLLEFESDVLLLDPMLPDLDPGEFNSLIKGQFPEMQIVTVNPHTGQPLLRSSSPSPLAAQVVEMLEWSGGSLQAPVHPPSVESGRVPAQHTSGGLPGMVGTSECMQRVYGVTRLVARRDTTVVVMGESGTGKDLVAHALHLLSPRRNNPFAVVNCAAIPEPLLEAELFGYVKGAFTGAVQSRVGRIHAAQGGTLFLDEIGEMPLALQSKLLRFLEQGEVQRLGATDNFRVDVRVVAATNADLRKLVDQKLFREDLYYRLAVFPIKLPPLRERGEDVSLLAAHLSAKFAPGSIVSPEAMSILRQHTWPGNVRELRNVMERASILLCNSGEVKAEHIIL